ncbi:sodium-dependent transporter [Exilibacterium tricleocarpae]|uniref:Transporter n=1 Tax=Exilibacterium tricleocarpae TaxID=2591008 RepID=A0A545SZW9_9GAMM|nr:sodium-dependent transporter [Exilibacterium tricleocarpae]TQV70513.1 sodium-dependent transporter [Exilibacterium tricleocarpae]
MLGSGTAAEVDGSVKGGISWTSRFAFLMASVGFAVGLGNIWRFPYVTGENGGGAFVLVYLVCAFAIGVPILMAELLLGRRGGMSPANSMRNVALQQGRSRHWQLLGGMNMLAAFTVLIVYCVIAGWVLNYLFKAVLTGFAGADVVSAAQSFEALLGSPGTLLAWTLVSLIITGLIIYAGVQSGIERAVTVMMPALFALMIALVGYNMVVGGFGEAIDYLFTADFSKINAAVVLAAIGQAFFSIGVAMAGMMTYGAYLPKDVSIPRSVVVIVFADTLVALLAGLVIFPAVFNNGLDPAGGPGLIFQTLPVAFAGMPGGHLVSVLFFLLLSVAAITSMLGLIEPLTRWLEEHKGFARHNSAIVMLITVALLSVLSILGYNLLSDYTLGGRDINGVMDYFSNQILLPLGGLLIAVFVGWFVSRQVAAAELGLGRGLLFNAWYFLIRYVAPVAVLLVFVLGVAG